MPPGWDVSITEAEYLAARAAGIPVLAFFLEEVCYGNLLA